MEELKKLMVKIIMLKMIVKINNPSELSLILVLTDPPLETESSEP